MATADRRHDPLLTPGEVAMIFLVGSETIQSWAETGRLTPVRSLTGRRRYRATEVVLLIEESVH